VPSGDDEGNEAVVVPDPCLDALRPQVAFVDSLGRGPHRPPAPVPIFLVGGKTMALALPSGEIRLKPSCDMGGASSCTVTLRIVGKTKSREKFEREVQVKVKKR
jgi:hypothetical protein